jgi:hypothetical protein
MVILLINPIAENISSSFIKDRDPFPKKRNEKSLKH